MDPGFLPQFPLALSYPLLFGLLLLAGMLGGEAARALGLPRIVGYVVVGGMIAPVIEALALNPLVEQARIFVDLALGLVLFDLGRRMNLDWMKRDWTLAASGAAESFLTFGAVFASLVALDFRVVDSAIAASIAIGTSPAVVLLIVQDTRSEGQVTERALNLVALNARSLRSCRPSWSPRPTSSSCATSRKRCCTRRTCSSARCCSARQWRASRGPRAYGRKSPDLHFTLIGDWWSPP